MPNYDQTFMRYLQSWLGSGDIHTTPYVNLGFPDSAIVDAFGRLRVSDPVTIFDTTLTDDGAPLLWSKGGNGTVTWTVNESANVLSVPANGTVINQSKQYSHYQAGKSLSVSMTGVMGSAVPDVAKRWGYFDGSNGIFWELAGDGTVYIVKRSSVSGSPDDDKIAQANWNVNALPDLDPTKAQIFFADLEWLGVGRVRVGFYVAGEPVVCHEFLNANLSDGVYMSTASLPCRYEMVSSGGTAADMKQICSVVMSEGGLEEDLGFPFAADTGPTARTAGTTGLPVIAIRQGTVYGPGSVVPRFQVIPESVKLHVATNPAKYSVMYGGTVQGGSWVQANANSGVEYNIGGTAMSGGFALSTDYVTTAGAGALTRGQGGGPLLSKLPIANNIDGTASAEVVVFATGIGGDAAVRAAVNWRELH